MKNIVGDPTWVLEWPEPKFIRHRLKRDKLTVVFGSFMLWALTNFLPHTWKNCLFIIWRWFFPDSNSEISVEKTISPFVKNV